MTAFKKIFLSPLLILPTACATNSLSTRDTIIRDMLLGGAAGGLLAQSKNDHRDAYTKMYFAIGAASAAAVSVYYNLSKEEQMKKENESLKAKLDDFQKKLEPKLIQKGDSLFTSPIPKEVSSLVEPGEWKRYKMDEWVQDPNDQNTWIRQTEMFQIVPPAPR